jgi:hypothetical protein
VLYAHVNCGDLDEQQDEEDGDYEDNEDNEDDKDSEDLGLVPDIGEYHMFLNQEHCPCEFTVIGPVSTPQKELSKVTKKSGNQSTCEQ